MISFSITLVLMKLDGLDNEGTSKRALGLSFFQLGLFECPKILHGFWFSRYQLMLVFGPSNKIDPVSTIQVDEHHEAFLLYYF